MAASKRRTVGDEGLGGAFWNEFEEDLLGWYFTTVEAIVKALMRDGYPAFTTPLTPERRYQTLLALRNAQHPIFMNSELAQKELDKLARQLGDWPPPPPPMSGLSPAMGAGAGIGGFQPFGGPGQYE